MIFYINILHICVKMINKSNNKSLGRKMYPIKKWSRSINRHFRNKEVILVFISYQGNASEDHKDIVFPEWQKM